MKRILLPAALVCAAALLVPSQAAAIIQLDRGIAGARLNNTQAQVRAALGKPAQVRRGRNEFGTFTVFRYRGLISVTFQGNRRVTSVSTQGLGDRTARGIGVGSTRRAVRTQVPGVRCRSVGRNRGICERGRFLPGERVTAFHLRNGRVVQVTVGFVID